MSFARCFRFLSFPLLLLALSCGSAFAATLEEFGDKMSNFYLAP